MDADNDRTPVMVIAQILPKKHDPSTEAYFANVSRAEQYALVLLRSGDYSTVEIFYGEQLHVLNKEA